MTRRRPTFRQYLRRRWRAVGLVAVLLLGAILVLVVTDRGHDPVWDARTSLVEEVVLAPDGGVAYALAREGGSIARLEARSGADGSLLWQSPLNATRALLRSSGDEVAVATDFPRAFLTVYGEDGTARYQMPLEGNPRAMMIEDGVVALALQASGNPVLVVENGQVSRVHHFSALVNALDVRDGRLVVGTGDGQVVAFDARGARLLNASLPLVVRSVRFDGGGTLVAVAGADRAPVSLTGMVALLDTGAEAPLRWSRTTSHPVGLVDLDGAGDTVLVVEAGPASRLHALDARDGRVRWSLEVEGVVPRDDAGAFGGAAISPDGSSVAAVTLRGPVNVYDAGSGALRWAYDAEGASVVAFARDAPADFVTNARLVQSGSFDALLLFSAGGEPTAGRLPVVAAALTALAAVGLATVVGVGFWRARRSW